MHEKDKKKMEKLKDEIRCHDFLYYVEDRPRISDRDYDRLMQDETLRDLHETGLAWHRAKAAELHGMPEFEDLYQQALKVKLNETERVAYALALDMES